MKNKDRIKIDNIVFLEPGINVKRWNKKIRKGKIIKVGRKYFQVVLLNEDDQPMMYTKYKFNINDLMQATDYSADYFLYLNEEDLKNKKVREDCINLISQTFRYTNISSIPTDVLIKISDLIKENV